MAFTYGGDPGSSVLDYGRFIIGDTVERGHILEDAEIMYYADIYTVDNTLDVLPFKASLFRQAATMYAIRAAKRTLGPQSEDTRDRLAYFKDEADKAEAILHMTGLPPSPDYEYHKVFAKNMMANGVEHV